MPNWGDGFEIETLINIRVAKANHDIREVASFESVRRSGGSNPPTFRDATRALATIIRERLIPAIDTTQHVATTRPTVVDRPVPSAPVPKSEAM